MMVVSGGYALFSINMVPALMGLTSDENRNSAYATTGVLRGLGAFVGTPFAALLPGLFASMIGVGLDSPAPYRLALWLSPAVLAAGPYPPAAHRRSRAERQTRRETDSVGFLSRRPRQPVDPVRLVQPGRRRYLLLLLQRFYGHGVATVHLYDWDHIQRGAVRLYLRSHAAADARPSPRQRLDAPGHHSRRRSSA